MNQKILEVVLDLKDRFSPKLKGTATKSNRALTSLSTTVKGLVAALASLVILRQVARWFGQAILAANAYNRSLVSLQTQTMQIGVASDQLITSLQVATGAQVSLAELTSASNRAIALLGREAVPRFAELADVAARAAQVMGTDVTRAFDDIVTGIGRQSRMILDNLGIIVNAEQAYSSYAAELGITTDELTENQSKQAFLNATIDQAIEKYGAIALQIDPMQKLNAAWSDFQVTIGGFIANSPVAEQAVLNIANSLNILIGATNESGTTIQSFVNDILFGLFSGANAAALAVLGLAKTIASFTGEALAQGGGVFGEAFRAIFPGLTLAGLASLDASIDAIDSSIGDVVGSQFQLIGAMTRGTQVADQFANTLSASGGAGLAAALNETTDAANDASDAVQQLGQDFSMIFPSNAEVRIRELIDLLRNLGARVQEASVQTIATEMGLRGRGTGQRPSGRGPLPKDGRGFNISDINEQAAFAAALGAFGGGGGFGGALGAALPVIGSAFGPVGAAVGGLIGGLFGRKKQRGDTPSNPVFTKIINPDDISTAFLNVVKPLLGAGTAGAINDLTAQIRLQGQRIGAS